MTESTTLTVLVVGRGVVNASLRWIPLFLPTIARALDTSLGHLTLLLGLGELLGVTGLATGVLVQRQGPRRWLLVGLVLAAIGNAVASGAGGVELFALGYAVMVAGQSSCFISGESWIGHEVPPERRGHHLGVYESSWALSLLCGAPVAAALVAISWRAPLWAWAALALVVMVPSAIVVPNRWSHPVPERGPATPTPDAAPTGGAHVAAAEAAGAAAGGPHAAAGTADGSSSSGSSSSESSSSGSPSNRRRIRPAGAVVVVACLLMFANLTVIVVSGAWAEDHLGFGSRQLGALAFVLGGAELVASVAVARLVDRWGASRAVRRGAVLLMGAAIALWVIDLRPTTALAVAVLALFVAGFEFAFISTLGLALHHAGAHPARLVGLIGTATTLARAAAVALAGALYDAAGLGAILAVCLTGVVAAQLVLVRLMPGAAPPAH